MIKALFCQLLVPPFFIQTQKTRPNFQTLCGQSVISNASWIPWWSPKVTQNCFFENELLLFFPLFDVIQPAFVGLFGGLQALLFFVIAIEVLFPTFLLFVLICLFGQPGLECSIGRFFLLFGLQFLSL